MIPPFGLMPRWSRPQGDRCTRPRSKAATQPRGVGRARLAALIRALGVYDERIAARGRAERILAEYLEAEHAARGEQEQRIARAREAKRAARMREDQWFAWQLRRQRLSRLWDRERAMLAAEQRRFALLLKEELAHQAMTPAEAAADQFDEQVVAWLGAEAPAAT